MTSLRIGLAGWSEAVQKYGNVFPPEGRPLSRYSSIFNAVEINASFYRMIPRSWYENWYNETPEDFKFSVKLPRSITHTSSLQAPERLEEFFHATSALHDKLGALLLQFPPRLTFDPQVLEPCLGALRAQFAGLIALEPRHLSWGTPEAYALYAKYDISLVITEVYWPPETHPPSVPLYIRLHGAPRRYASPYSSADLARLSDGIRASGTREAWVIFNNTASRAGVANARELQEISTRISEMESLTQSGSFSVS